MDYLSSLLLLCSHVASNFSSYGSSFLFPCHASHGYAVAICSNFLLGLCCHLQVASYLIFHHVIANCCYLSVCAAVLPCIFCLCLLLSSAAVIYLLLVTLLLLASIIRFCLYLLAAAILILIVQLCHIHPSHYQSKSYCSHLVRQSCVCLHPSCQISHFHFSLRVCHDVWLPHHRC